MKNIKEYTLILIHYQQIERLKFALDTWAKQTIRPKEILIIDDGTPNFDKVSFTGLNLNIKIFSISHSGNLGKMINYGVSLVKTTYYLILEPSLLPLGPFFAEKMLSRVDKGIQAIPLYGITDTLSPFQGGFDCILFDHTYGDNKIYDFENKQKFLKICASGEYETDSSLAPSYYFPIDGFMKHIDDFLQYNETYDCWGCYDLDYQFRCVQNSIQSYLYYDMAFIHWNHPKVGDMYSRPQNLRYLAFCKEYYKTNKITFLSETEAKEIQTKYAERKI